MSTSPEDLVAAVLSILRTDEVNGVRRVEDFLKTNVNFGLKSEHVSALREQYGENVFSHLPRSRKGMKKVLETQHEKDMRKLETNMLEMGNASVIRDGGVIIVERRELVPGDLINLELGDTIPADCIVVDDCDLLVDDSEIGGKKKHPPSDFDPLLFCGSCVMEGFAKAVVVAVGSRTHYSKRKLREDVPFPRESTN